MEAKTNQSSYIFTADSGNTYLQDVKENVLMYLHPRLKELLEGSNPKDDEYYLQKKKFIDRFLSDDYDLSTNFSGTISGEMVKKNIVNTNQITFEVTDACNLNCEYCGYGELYGGYDRRAGNFLKWDIAKKILDFSIENWKSDNYPSHGKEIAVGFYGGEPLLNIKLIKQIVTYLENAELPWIKFKYVMTTNGMLLSRHIDYLLDKDFRISVSLDGDKINNAYRVNHKGEESFYHVFENLNEVKRRFPSKFETNINFLSVLHGKNSMSSIHKFFKESFNKRSFVSEVNSNNIKEDKRDAFLEIYRNKMESLNSAENVEQIKEDIFIGSPDNSEVMYYINCYSGNMMSDYDHFFIRFENVSWVPTGTCIPFSKRMFVTVNGKILPCERISQVHALGYVDDLGVHLNENEIALKYNNYYNNLSSLCTKCHRIKGCLECIFNLKDIEKYGKVICKGFTGVVGMKKYFARNISLLEKDTTLYGRIMREVVLEL